VELALRSSTTLSCGARPPLAAVLRKMTQRFLCRCFSIRQRGWRLLSHVKRALWARRWNHIRGTSVLEPASPLRTVLYLFFYAPRSHFFVL
jgi:hypothetical protein